MDSILYDQDYTYIRLAIVMIFWVGTLPSILQKFWFLSLQSGAYTSYEKEIGIEQGDKVIEEEQKYRRLSLQW